MADYKLRREGGVYKTDTMPHAVVTVMDYVAWTAYNDWVKAGNTPDPMDPEPPDYPTLPAQRAEALARLRALGLDKLVIGTLSHNGNTYPLTQEWLTALNCQPQGATVLNTLGVAVTLNPGQANALRDAVAARVALAVQRYSVLVGLINASPAPLTVDITAGWPT